MPLTDSSKPHRFINRAIATLALLLAALMAFLAWKSYADYRTSRVIVHNVRLADLAVKAMQRYAAERGITASVLGAGGKATPDLFRLLVETRGMADEAWREATALAGDLPHEADLVAALDEVQRALEELQQVRSQVDRWRAGQAPAAPIGRWLAVSSRFISVSGKVWETAFRTGITSDSEVLLLPVPRKILWDISEQAGRERGILAYYLGTRAPLPPDAREQLALTRGMVLFGIERLQRYFDVPSTDRRIAEALRNVERRYLRDFEKVRAQVYAAAGTGRYPMAGKEWMRRATEALDSFFTLSTALTAVTTEQADALQRRGVLWMALSLSLFGGSLGLVGISFTSVRRLVNDLFRQKELAQVTMDSIGDAVITTDAQVRVEYLNPVAEELTGWTDREAHGRLLTDVFRILQGYTREPKASPVERCLKEDRVVGLGNDTLLVRRDGMEFVIEDSAAPIRDRENRIVGAVMVFYDVSSQRGNTHILSYQATHDTLTGLMNRREFERRLEMLLNEARTRGTEHAVCYLDLDQFKVINDTCGHGVGDKLLRQLTAHLKARVRATDTLARLGGDEFGLLLHRCPLDKAIEVAENLRQIVHDFRFAWDDKTYDVGVCIGVVPVTADSGGVEQVLGRADAACYAAKDKGRDRIQVYGPQDIDLARRHGEMQWVTRLTHALETDQFRLYYQPIRPLVHGGVTHHEILLRLRDQSGALVLPAMFIPAAERYNLMPRIDRWVIERTLSTLAKLRERGAAREHIYNINISGASLGDENVLGFIRQELERHRLPPGAICFEITETAAVTNIDFAVNFILTLKRSGCRFALDDFGTGVCSFGYLKELKADYLKIGGAFVKDMATDATAYATVQAINTIGHTLHMQTVAEFVESDELLRIVGQVGVDYAQGFAVAEPQPMDDRPELAADRPTA